MFVIGHRGAAGLVLENTAASLNKALELGVDAIEFDIRLTKDGQPVLYHDDNLKRLTGQKRKIRDVTFAELQKITLPGGHKIIHLREALKIVSNTPVIVDVKAPGSVKATIDVLQDFPKANIRIASSTYPELAVLKHLRPDIKSMLLIRIGGNPFEAITFARSYGADGIDINFWIMNPITYWAANKFNMDIMMYTVNNRLLARFLQKLYPGAWICTNYPDRFVK